MCLMLMELKCNSLWYHIWVPSTGVQVLTQTTMRKLVFKKMFLSQRSLQLAQTSPGLTMAIISWNSSRQVLDSPWPLSAGTRLDPVLDSPWPLSAGTRLDKSWTHHGHYQLELVVSVFKFQIFTMVRLAKIFRNVFWTPQHKFLRT